MFNKIRVVKNKCPRAVLGLAKEQPAGYAHIGILTTPHDGGHPTIWKR
jgi:hypothetical protein